MGGVLGLRFGNPVFLTRLTHQGQDGLKVIFEDLHLDVSPINFLVTHESRRLAFSLSWLVVGLTTVVLDVNLALSNIVDAIPIEIRVGPLLGGPRAGHSKPKDILQLLLRAESHSGKAEFASSLHHFLHGQDIVLGLVIFHLTDEVLLGHLHLGRRRRRRGGSRLRGGLLSLVLARSSSAAASGPSSAALSVPGTSAFGVAPAAAAPSPFLRTSHGAVGWTTEC
mmetsp:Transcript_19615/g.42202  ORF Transcript_19615/g.42202 Transcript_19615/m.42202 type:complete len:224 (-) Transcript_19615:8-679(-)